MKAIDLNPEDFSAIFKDETSILTIKYKSNKFDFEVDSNDYWDCIEVENQEFDVNFYIERHLDTNEITYKGLEIYGLTESGQINTSDYLDIPLEIL